MRFAQIDPTFCENANCGNSQELASTTIFPAIPCRTSRFRPVSPRIVGVLLGNFQFKLKPKIRRIHRRNVYRNHGLPDGHSAARIARPGNQGLSETRLNASASRFWLAARPTRIDSSAVSQQQCISRSRVIPRMARGSRPSGAAITFAAPVSQSPVASTTITCLRRHRCGIVFATVRESARRWSPGKRRSAGHSRC